MRVPWQGSVGCDGQLDRRELWPAGRVVRVRLAVPRLSCLHQDFAMTACNALRAGLSKYGRQRCYDDSGNSNGAVLRNHVGRLLWVLAVWSKLSVISLFAGVGYTPNTARAVICNVESAIVTYCYSYRAAPYLSVCGDESGKKILVLAGGFAVPHGNPDNFVASAIRTVPGPM